MKFSIGQVSRLFDLPISTLRYYDRQGFFPHMVRKGGIREFGEEELEALRVVDCLKKTGMEIKDIQTFMQLCEQGSSTYPQRKDLFCSQLEKVDKQIQKLEKAKAMIEFKKWYYMQAEQYGSEEPVLAMIPDLLPPEIRLAYDTAHALDHDQDSKQGDLTC